MQNDGSTATLLRDFVQNIHTENVYIHTRNIGTIPDSVCSVSKSVSTVEETSWFQKHVKM